MSQLEEHTECTIHCVPLVSTTDGKATVKFCPGCVCLYWKREAIPPEWMHHVDAWRATYPEWTLAYDKMEELAEIKCRYDEEMQKEIAAMSPEIRKSVLELFEEKSKESFSDFAKEMVLKIYAEIGYQKSLAHAREIGAECYCCYHACDATKCPDDGVHGDD